MGRYGICIFPNLAAEQARAGLKDPEIAEKVGLDTLAYRRKKKNGHFFIQEAFDVAKVLNKDVNYLFVEDPLRRIL